MVRVREEARLSTSPTKNADEGKSDNGANNGPFDWSTGECELLVRAVKVMPSFIPSSSKNPEMLSFSISIHTLYLKADVLPFSGADAFAPSRSDRECDLLNH